MANSRAKGNKNENEVKEIMQNAGFFVEKQKAKPRFAKGNTDFFGEFDLICVPKITSKHQEQVFIQVRSRKQYGKEKSGVEEFVKETKPTFKAYFSWPEGRGRNKLWKFELIKKKGQGCNTFQSQEDW